MAVVIPDTTPAELLARFRGKVTSSRPGHPEVLLLQVTDTEGGLWRFATFEADYVPTDPDVFLGKTVVAADLDVPSGKLKIRFSDDSALLVVPFVLPPDEVDTDYESWHLLTPEGVVLDYGPGDYWALAWGSDPA
jgi:hypothetical protein